MNALEVQNLEVRYGRVQALRGLSLRVGVGETVAVLGNNGAGKSTLLAAISGVVRASGGTVRAFGTQITDAPPWQIVGAGVVHVPEGRRVFSGLTVHENLQLGGYLIRDRDTVDERIGEVYRLLPRLRERRTQPGGTLSGGEQQLLAIGRALVAGPRLLMLDEPSMGLAPLLVTQVMHLITEIRERGTSVLLVEQNARAALRVADRGYVIEDGVATVEGSAVDLVDDARVVRAYLGR